MRVGIVSVQVPFVEGGAEIHARNLLSEFKARKIDADLITFPFKWYPPQSIVDSIAISRMLDLTESMGVTIDKIIGLKFPAYLIPHPNKILWILHQHRTAYDLWDDHDFGDLINFPDGRSVRDTIRYADEKFIPEARAIYTNSENVSARLLQNNNIQSTPLYHPPNNADGFQSGEAQDYIFFPSRINVLKRQKLAVEALAQCVEPVKLIFAGAAESPAYFRELQELARNLGVDHRIVWKGYIGEADKIALYAGSLAVLYPPVNEDYGYVTLEAMLARKPVITTMDAGGPLEFMTNGETGLIVGSDASALASAMDMLWTDRNRAKTMGDAGFESYQSKRISWDNVIDVLMS